MKKTLRILASLQILISVFTGMVGSFADGGQWWERLVLVGVHPVAAVLLLILVIRAAPQKKLVAVTVAFLALNVVADVLLALAIGTGVTKGDWWLPLIFAVIPLIAFPHSLSQLRRS